VGLDAAAAALRGDQPLRRREERLDHRRPQARDPQVHPRRQDQADDHRHLRRAGRRRHALQPADLHGLVPDGSFVVADGYNGTRVAKFDKDGKFLAAWGEKGSNQNDTRPAFFNNVHGISIDPKTRRIFVNDRGNHRVQVFDKNGKFLDSVAVRRQPVGRCTCSTS
jgi:6-phosphogluconolactonase (cycloisomerase 2 family)